MRRKDGSAFPVEVLVSALPDGELQAVVLDVSERKQAEEALHRLNRELRAISSCNQALMRAEDEQALLNDICHIVCDGAGYRMAWVGYAENDVARTVRPVTWAGVEDGYLDAAGITWADTERGRGATGTAIRSGESTCIQDFQTDPQAAAWREDALQRGYRSNVALPLKDKSANTFGALTIYSTEPNAFFVPDEMRLLEELAGDLAFGITVLRARTERKRAEEELRESEQRFRTFVEESSEGFTLVDEQGAIIEWNHAREKMTGLPASQVIGQKLWDVLHQMLAPELQTPERYERNKQPMLNALQTGKSPLFDNVLESEVVRQKGERQSIQQTIFPIKTDKGYRMGSVTRDITERKRAESRLQRELEGGRILLELYDRAPLLADGQLFDYALDQAVRLTDSSIGFFHRVSDDQATVILTTWNAEALRGCAAVYDTDCLIDQAGNWADCVRLRRPIVYNDYQTSSNRRGLPPGHSPVLRFMSVPVLEGDKVRYIFGVGNKTEPYEDGDVVQLQLVANELQKIVVQRRAEEALRASEERYRRFVEDDVAGVSIATPDGRVLTCNPAFARMLGFASIEEALATNVVTIYQDPAEREAFLAELRARGRVDDRELALRRCDGSPLTVVETAIGEFDEGGELVAIRGYVIDITERKRAETKIRENEERYRRITETITDYVFTANVHDGRVVSTVHSPGCVAVTGYSSDEIARDPDLWLRMVVSEDREAVLEQARRIVSGQRLDPVEHRIVHKDGRIRWVRNTPVPQFGPDGTLVSYDGLIQDITERRMLREQLRQSQKMEAIGRLAGGIAHDFNNLLTAINGYADILMAGMAPGEPRRADVEEIRKAGDRAAALTRQLLTFSRRQVLQAKVIDLNVVVAGIAPMLRRLVGEQIELRALPAPDLGRVRADPSQIEQVLLNLAVNARDAMPAGGTLTIETANVELDDEYLRMHTLVAPGPHVLLAVSDTGTGMDAETMAHLFEPFFTTKAPGEGTGLGLATVYGIVTGSGGHVAAHSEPGHGSVFKVYLPSVAETLEPRAEVAAGPAAGGAETILLVEDEDAVRSYVERVLGRLGYTVTTARSGDEALALAADHAGPIDLLVTDVMLPGMNGRELSKRLTARQPSLRTLFISGYTGDSIVHHGVLDPGIAFLSKPFTPDALGNAVREVLGAQTLVSGGPDH